MTQPSGLVGSGCGRLLRTAQTFRPFPRDEVEGSIPARFERLVTEYPARLAVKSRDDVLTYADLDRLANRIAHGLLATRGTAEEPVVLLLRQGAPLVAAILGVLKAGKFYVPLDPAHPPMRLADALGNAGAAQIVTDDANRALAERLAGDRRAVVDVDRVDPRVSAERPGLTLGPDRLAYLFYTSGSTGQPKGVLDSHRNVLHNVMRYTNALGIGSDDRLSLLQSASFSGSVSSLFCALLNGAAVFPYDIRREGMGASLAAWVAREHLTIYHSVPMIFRSWLAGQARFPDVRVIRLEGDAASRLDVELYRRHFGPTCTLANGLGATETGLSCQLLVGPDAELPGGIVPVGFPLPDMEVLLLDDTGAEVGPGAVGEIAVKSRYLALGYWQDPELTRAAFLPDPGGDGARTYRTGDLGRRRPDGCVEYLGRQDFQRKIQGHRVEPAEVEAALLALDTVREAVVTTREDWPGEPRLVAYLVPASPAPLAVGAIRRALAVTLLDYMIPSTFVTLEALPLTANGKVDRRALPAPERVRPGRPESFVAPRDEVERGLAELWEEVLGVPGVGVRDRFVELGGDSLRAATLCARIQGRFQRSLSGAVVAQTATIEELARVLRSEPDDAVVPAVVAVQSGGGERPLFFVDIPRGAVDRYAGLAHRLGRDRPFYVVRPYGGWTASAPEPRMEDIAARGLEAVRSIQPAGPYFLSGLCYGAVVAFEMARQCRARGERVGLLALCGISPWDFPRLVSPRAWARYRWHQATARGLDVVGRVRHHAHRAAQGGVRDGLVYLARLLGRVTRRQVLRVAPVAALGPADQRAFRAYVPRPYPGDLVLCLARETIAVYATDARADWEGLATGRVTVHELPGGDLGLFEEPVVGLLAECLGAALDEGRATVIA